MTLQITSTVFEPGKPIPRKYTGDGQDLSPPLSWSGLPAETRELALTIEDPDAPTPKPYVHWVIAKIPAGTSGLPEGMAADARPRNVPGALQGVNDFKKTGYGGPAPPPGHGTHHYHFCVYALDQPLDVPAGADIQALRQAMAGHVLDSAELVGTYERPA